MKKTKDYCHWSEPAVFSKVSVSMTTQGTSQDRGAFSNIDLKLGESRMADAIRAFDWSNTPLGPPSTWPPSLVVGLRLMLNTAQPISLWWGPDLINFHNDAYEPMLGGRAGGALGQPARALWPDVWKDVWPLVEKALAGHSTRVEDMPLLMTRSGYDEPTNWSFSYSPVFNDDGNVAGMMNIVVEATEHVRGREQFRQTLDDGREHIRIQREFEQRQRELQSELAHRMKNTIAIIQAVVSQTLRNASSTQEASETINGRLIAMARPRTSCFRAVPRGWESVPSSAGRWKRTRMVTADFSLRDRISLSKGNARSDFRSPYTNLQPMRRNTGPCPPTRASSTSTGH